MKDILRKIKRMLAAWLLKAKLKRETRKAFRYDCQQFLENAGALHLDRRNAAVAEIVMGYHVLEKGLTMPKRRLGFGQGAVLRLIELIKQYEARFGLDEPQVEYAIGVLRSYRQLHSEWPEPMPRLDAFLEQHPRIPAAHEPHVTRDEFFAAKDKPFPEFAASRHVVRHFSGAIPRETLENAMKLALTAPSACNRQHARIHVIDSKALMEKLFAAQGGTRGFGQDADKAIVVTVDLSAIRWSWERHDIYTNGGIFVMNLCYALHYYGIAHCILHWSVPPEVDVQAHELLEIPSNEAIVQVIACGMPPAEFDVAGSPRRELSEVMKWHS